MITIYQCVQNMGIRDFSRRDLKTLGVRCARKWIQKNKDLPVRVEQQEGGKLYKVFAYPDRYKMQIEKLVAKHFEKKVENLSGKTGANYNVATKSVKSVKTTKPTTIVKKESFGKKESFSKFKTRSERK